MFRKLLIWLVLFALLLSSISVATAATPPPPKPAPQAPDDGLQVSLDATGGGIQNVGSSTLANVTPAYLPIGGAFDLCFTVFVQSPDAEYMDHFEADLPDGWTVNSVAPDSVPPANGCSAALPPVAGVGAGNIVYWQSTGYPPQTGCGAWNGSSSGLNFDFCTNITIPDATGAPWDLPWYYVGDGWGATPHEVSGTYGPIEPQPPIQLRPELIEEIGCPCGPQEHELTVGNSAGYDTFVDLSYTLVSGEGHCSGPPSVFVPNGGNAAFTVRFVPVGQPGDTVVCEVYAEDASDPANNDTSAIMKHLLAGFFDPAGWQLEPITGATPNQWAGGVVGTNPAAAGPVGYVVGGLAAGSSVINPDLQMYDPGTGTWTQLADLPNPRFSPVVGWIGGLLYAAGGYDVAFGATNDLQVYDPGTNTWDNATPPDMPVARGGGAGGVGVCASGTGPCLFHVGGGPDSSFANTTLETWQFNPGTNAWTQLDNKPAGSSPDGHILGAGVGCMGQIYVGGDYRGFDEFFRLDATQPAGSQWTQLANMPAGAGSMTPALVCKEDWGKIVLIGGDPDGGWGTYNTTVYVYDIATDTWEGPLPQTLHVGQLGSVGWHLYDRVWTAGGTVGSGAISPMPFESLLQVQCDPGLCLDLFEVWKDAPPTAEYGDVISYTITILPQVPMDSLFMVDPIPAGTEYADNLSWTAGNAWYDPGDNAVHWEYAAPPRTAAPAVPVPRLAPDPAAAAELAGGPEIAGAPVPEGVPIFQFPKGVLWDNGPLVTHPGECSGVDASRLQTDLAMNTLGFGHQLSVGNRMADDFQISDPLGWHIDQITFFAYQTNAPAGPSPITGVYYQIWDGPPDNPASNVVFGDLAANRLITTTFTNIQRDSGTSPCTNARYIFADVASAGVWLPQGIYWLDWMTDGSLASGPWAPPITIPGQTTTGNALQYTTSSGAWGPANDSGTLTQQGMPFLIEGDPLPIPEITFDVTVTAHCGEPIVNEGLAAIDGITKTFAAATMVGGEATIAVSPSPLDASLCPDTTITGTLSICNEGDCPLWWSLGELAPPPFAGSMPFVPVDVTGKGPAPEGLTVSGAAPAQLAEPEAPMYPDAVLWDQPLSTVNQSAWVDQEFPDFAAFSSFLADDFTNADEWLINTIFVPGSGWNGFSSLMDAMALTWQIYADDGAGFPDGDPAGGGNPPVWTLTLPPNDPHVTITPGSDGLLSNTTLNPPVPVILPPGDWWLVFYPTAPFSTFGQYGRQAADTTNGAVGKFINPGGGFGLGTNWQDWTVLGGQPPDIAFRLEGIVMPDLGDIPWLSETPISGTVPWGECQDVEVTFDATGLAPGDYTGELVILSNDLATPQTIVSTTMTVLEAVDLVSVIYSIDDLEVTFDATATGSEPIVYAWDFDDGNTSADEDPIHVYDEGGCYTVTLAVENACALEEWSEEICVCEPVFGAAFSWSPAMPAPGTAVDFSATVGGGTAPFTYTWDFGDGFGDTGMDVSHTYSAAGDYVVELTVENACGTDVVTDTVTVETGKRYVYLPIVVKND